MPELPWKSPMPRAAAEEAAEKLFEQKTQEGKFITADGQRVMLTRDEVMQLVACYWEVDVPPGYGTAYKEGLKASPFEGMPSGGAIAEWWCNDDHDEDGKAILSPARHYSYIQGTEGFDIFRDGNDYCYVWMEAFVDADMEGFYLLDVRTSQGGTETRDYLYVAMGAGCGVECTWQQKPINFHASAEDHQNRFWDGMGWFRDQIEVSREAWCS